MLTSPEPDRNVEELDDDQIYAAIRYLELAPVKSGQSADNASSNQSNDHGVVISICLYIALLGCLVLRLYWR